MTLKRMEPNTRKLLLMIKKNLDPQGIMNPGNWEVNYMDLHPTHRTWRYRPSLLPLRLLQVPGRLQ